MATKKTPNKKPDKKEAKKAASKKEAKKPTPKKKAPVKPKFIEIVYLNRTPEAIAEMRSAIVNEDILAHINDIEEDYRSLLKMINKCARPVHEDTTKWHMILKVLDNRSRNAHKLLNKVVPDFKEEELLNSDVGDNASINPEAARDAAIAKLSKALKPKSKVSHIKNA